MKVKVRKKPVRVKGRASNTMEISNNALFSGKVRCILRQLPKSIIVDDGCEFTKISIEIGRNKVTDVYDVNSGDKLITAIN